MNKVYSHTYTDSENNKINIEFEVIENSEILIFQKGIEPDGVISSQKLNLFFDFKKRLTKYNYIVVPLFDKIPKNLSISRRIKNNVRLFKRNNSIYTNIDSSILVYLLDGDITIAKKIIHSELGIIKKHLYNLVFVTFPSDIKQDNALNRLNKLPNVLAEINFAYDSFAYSNPLSIKYFTYNDPPIKKYNNNLYNVIENIHAKGHRGNPKLNIGIIDDGIYPHKSLLNSFNQLLSYDYINNSSHQTFDANDWHGTMCAGIIGSQILKINRKEYGMYGVACGCKLVSLKIKKNKETSIFYFLNAIFDASYSNSMNISVLNCSLGIDFQESEIMKLFLTKCLNDGRNGLGLPLVFSAGNNGSEISFLHKLPVVITVASVDIKNSPVKLSNFGNEVLVSAFGEKVITLDKPGNIAADNTETIKGFYDYIYFSATSAAAPQVTGGIALLLSKSPNLKLTQIKDQIKLSIDPKFKNGLQNKYGTGVFNLNKLNI